MQGSVQKYARRYDKPHKFFEKYLDNDLNKLSDFLEKKYKEIEEAKVPGVSKLHENGREVWLESGSLSTVKWKEYNVFQFYNEEIYNLFIGVRETVKEACQYYGVNFEQQQYMIQGWFNITHSGKGKLDWHDHGGPFAPFFHGYYCVNAEPSVTNYKIFNNDAMIVNNVNKNNRLIVSEMGHPHAMGDWEWEGSRITIAYDIMPLKALTGDKNEQHFFPL
jgi:hypothetical protein